MKDQGQCGSCWAFSATGSLEGQTFAKTKSLVSLAEQQLVDCSSKFGNEGCNGGMMNSAFEYIKQNNGIDNEKSYPYQAYDGKCRFKPESVAATDYVSNSRSYTGAVGTIFSRRVLSTSKRRTKVISLLPLLPLVPLPWPSMLLKVRFSSTPMASTMNRCVRRRNSITVS